MEDISSQLENILKMKSSDPGGSTYQSLRKLNAKCLLKEKKFCDAAYNLVESIASTVRTMGTYRSERVSFENSMKENIEANTVHMDKIKNIKIAKGDNLFSYIQKDVKSAKIDVKLEERSTKCLKKLYIQHFEDEKMGIINMKKKLKELPNEWTVIQLTASYNASEQWQTERNIKTSVKEFYITVLKNPFLDLDVLDPFTVKIFPEKSKFGETPLFEEFQSTLEENFKVLKNHVKVTDKSTIERYWEKRNDLDQRLNSVISTMDKKWLQGWKCLLNGRIISEDLMNNTIKLVDDICLKNRFDFSALQKMLLYNLFHSVHYLDSFEMASILQKIYVCFSKQSCREKNDECKECGKMSENDVPQDFVSIVKSDTYKTYKKIFTAALESIKSEVELKSLKKCDRGPVILLLDERLDSFPWEILPILSSQPVTRIECLNMTYALFKEHENNISNGYFQLKSIDGKYILNPGGDLDRMEKRISSFLEYWCPKWEGKMNSIPPDLYEKYLQNSDVFLYCGHGDGSQNSGNGVDKITGVKTVAILSGCSSVSHLHTGTRLLPVPTYSLFHIAACPCIIGMLWEVSDFEVDKVISSLISFFIPSKALCSWQNVDKSHWTLNGKLGTGPTDIDKREWQPNLLKALCTARNSTRFVLISASAISRGLPVMIDPNYKII